MMLQNWIRICASAGESAPLGTPGCLSRETRLRSQRQVNRILDVYSALDTQWRLILPPHIQRIYCGQLTGLQRMAVINATIDANIENGGG